MLNALVVSTPMLGTMIDGRYRLDRLVGHGGMGCVFEARDLHGDREVVAIKLIHRVGDATALSRFEREARAALMAGHAHVVEILSFAWQEAVPYLVMEYVAGQNLKRAIETSDGFHPARAAHIASQVLDALACAHRQGIVHRDLKPENVLLTERLGDRDFVKLADFGVAAILEASADEDLTPVGRSMGTPWYSSPEQLEGGRVPHATIDIYAVGVLLFEMLTGYRPFEADNPADLCRAILLNDVPPLRVFRSDVPASLEAIVRRSLLRRPDDRFPSAEAMRQALRQTG